MEIDMDEEKPLPARAADEDGREEEGRKKMEKGPVNHTEKMLSKNEVTVLKLFRFQCLGVCRRV